MSADVVADGETVTDVFVARLAADSGVAEPVVRKVLTVLWGGGDLDTVVLSSTVRYALDVTYADAARGDGWPAAERIELPEGVDQAGAVWNAVLLEGRDLVDRAVVVMRGTVTTTGPWVAVPDDEDDEPKICVDCGMDTAPCKSEGWGTCPDDCDHTGAWEWYIVHDEVWAEADAEELDVLCVGCLEGRLGRPLTAADFPAIPVNEPSRNDTARLAAARTRVAS